MRIIIGLIVLASVPANARDCSEYQNAEARERCKAVDSINTWVWLHGIGTLTVEKPGMPLTEIAAAAFFKFRWAMVFEDCRKSTSRENKMNFVILDYCLDVYTRLARKHGIDLNERED